MFTPSPPWGLSQCLIKARLGIVGETRDMDTIDCYASQPESQRPLTRPAFKIFTNVITITDSRDIQLGSRDGGIQDYDVGEWLHSRCLEYCPAAPFVDI